MAIRATRPLVTVLIAVALVLGVGILTFFVGPSDDVETDVGPGYVDLDLSTVRGSTAAVDDVLFLPWGDGPTDASRKGEPAPTSTIESVFSSDGFIFVVDHPADLVGARVRWFTQDGELAGVDTAPSGSTFFRALPGGYDYVVAKSGGLSETAVLRNITNSAETTFTIPLQVNSGGLVFHDDVLYASVTPSDVDHDSQTIYSRVALIPVAASGAQIDDATADANSLDLWGYGLDGNGYTSEMQVMGLDVSSSEVITVIGSGESSVRVPRRYRLLGVSEDSRVFLSRMPAEVTYERPVQESAAWTASREPLEDVLVVDLDGNIESMIVIPYSTTVAWRDGVMPISLCEDGLYTLRADERGVTVVVHRFQ